MNDLNSTLKDGSPKNKSVHALKNIPTNIPPVRASLVGRDKEIKLIHDLLLREDISLITLTGLGGAGKTSLALQVAGYG